MSRERQQYQILSEKFFQENDALLERVRELESLNAQLQDDNQILSTELDIQNKKVKTLENQLNKKNNPNAIQKKQISKEPKVLGVQKKQQQRIDTEKRVTRSQVG
ncbi:hypothetical protein pb186bvf_008704 [Paramecium bursaria]